VAKKKEARKVSIDPSSPLNFEEFTELRDHALKSSIWYLDRYPCHSSKIRQRLLDKGYPEEPVRYVDPIEGELTISFPEATIQALEDLARLDDERYVESKLKGMVSRGKGLSQAKWALRSNGIPEEQLERAAEAIEGELIERESEALGRMAEKAMRTAPYRKAQGEWQRKMVISRYLMGRGFQRDSIDLWLDNNEELLGDN